MDEHLEAVLESFIVKVDPDAYGIDPPLFCRCGDQICTIEQDDTLALLVRTAVDHAATCAEFS